MATSKPLMFLTTGFPTQLYPPMLNCTSGVFSNENHCKFMIRIERQSFGVELSEGCLRDYLLIWDNSTVSVKLCGTLKKDFVWLSESNLIHLSFVSDNIVQKKGLKVTVTKLLKPHCDDFMSLLATTDSIIMLNKRLNSTRNCCTLPLRAVDPENDIVIMVQRFSLFYSGSNCSFDYFGVSYLNKRGHRVEEKWCGVKKPFEYVVFSNACNITLCTDLSNHMHHIDINYADNQYIWRQITEFPYHLVKDTVTLSLDRLEPQIQFNNLSGVFVWKFDTDYGNKLTVMFSDARTEKTELQIKKVWYSDRFLHFAGFKKFKQANVNYFHRQQNNFKIEVESFQAMLLIEVKRMSTADDYILPFQLTAKASPIKVEIQKERINNINFTISFNAVYQQLLHTRDKTSIQLGFRLSSLSSSSNLLYKNYEQYIKLQSFDLFPEFSDPSCNLSGIIYSIGKSFDSKLAYGPFCNASQFPKLLFSGKDGGNVFFYYFHDKDLFQEGRITFTQQAFRMSIGLYKCTPLNIMSSLNQVYKNRPCWILQASPTIHTHHKAHDFGITFFAHEPLLIFDTFTSSHFVKAIQSTATLGYYSIELFTNKHCSTVLTFVRRSISVEYHILYINYRSNCSYTPGDWSIHIESKCRKRSIPMLLNSDRVMKYVKHECGRLLSPNHPLPYELFEPPRFWKIHGNYFYPMTDGDYFQFLIKHFELGKCSESALIITEYLYKKPLGSRQIYLCDRYKRQYLLSNSNYEITLLFSANSIISANKPGFLIRYDFKTERTETKVAFHNECDPGWYGFQASCYKLIYPSKEKPSTWLDCESECNKLGAHLVAINSENEMQAIKSMLLRPEILNASFSYSSNTIFIGLMSKRDSFRPYHVHYRWTTGQPITYTEWYPNPEETILSKVSNNLKGLLLAASWQPSNENGYDCTAMMIHNPRHHANWIKIPCKLDIHDHSYLCEKSTRGAATKRTTNASQSRSNGRQVDPRAIYRCNHGWYLSGKKCYMMFSAAKGQKELSWKEANTMCREQEARVMRFEGNSLWLKLLSHMLKAWRFDYTVKGKVFVSEIFNNAKLYGTSFQTYDDSDNVLKSIQVHYMMSVHRENNMCYNPPTRNVICSKSAQVQEDWHPCKSQYYTCSDKSCISVDALCDNYDDCSGEYRFFYRVEKPKEMQLCLRWA